MGIEVKYFQRIKKISEDLVKIVNEIELQILNYNRRIPIEEIELSMRTSNILNGGRDSYSFRYLDEVAYVGAGLLKVKNFGRKSYNELRDILDEYGLQMNHNMPLGEERHRELLNKQREENVYRDHHQST